MYSKYVFDDKLISPVNGKSFKRLNAHPSTIKNFGFDSIEDLHKQYPGFPLICKKLSNKYNQYSKLGNEQNSLKYTNLYIQSEKTKCLNCSSTLSRQNNKGKFCSISCSTSYYNTNLRKYNKKQITKKTITKNQDPIKKIYICKQCNNVKQNPKKKYCGSCKTNIRHYRSLCSFKFNVYDYPLYFDLALIAEHGWYSPNGYKRRNKTPNINGVSRDHLYSVSDGFKYNRDPKILSHPANCSIMLHNGSNGNNSKHNKSSITWEELLLRIKNWPFN